MAPILSSLSFGSRGYGFIGAIVFPATITPSSSTINEGSSVTFTIATQLNTGVSLYWTLSGVSHSDVSGGVLSGSFTTSGTNGNTSNTVVVTTLIDSETDSDFMFLELRTGSVFGPIVKTSSIVTINNVSAPAGGTFSYQFASASSNGIQAASHVNVYFRRNIFQSIYTAAELTANGATSGATFNNLRWAITGAVPAGNSARGLNIRLFHTTAENGATLATAIGSKTTVYSVSDVTDVTQFESVGTALFNFSNTFTWDGTNNICIESCTAQNETNYTSAGTQRVFNTTSGGRYSWSDSAGTSCSDTPVTTTAYKPSVEMDFVGSPPNPVSATVTPSVSSVNEGGSVTFNVTTTNFTSGTLYWTLVGSATASDITQGSSGSFTITSSSGSVALNIADDLTTEGTETFGILIRQGGTSGTIVGSSSGVTINDTSTTPTASVTPSTTNLNEGSSVTFTVSTSLSFGTLYWTTNAVSGTINASDFTGGATSGSVAISGGSGSVVLTLANDTTTEGTESFQFEVRTGSTSGTIIATSSTVTINDTSITPPSTFGYFGGGSAFPAVYSKMDKLNYSTDTVTALPASSLSAARYAIGSTGNTSAGYFGGGAEPAPTFGGRSVIDKLNYSNDLRTTLVATLSNARYALTATGNSTAGYFGGGAPGGPQTTVDKLTYSTESVSPLPSTGSLSIGRRYLAATGNSTAGYFGGGKLPAPSVSTIDKLIYSTDTISISPTLIGARYSLAATGNSTAGYFGGGKVIFTSQVDKLIYSSDTIFQLPSTGALSSSRYGVEATGNSTAGYFGGGVAPGQPGYVSTMDKLTYSTDTRSTPVGTLSTNNSRMGAVSANANGLT